MLCEYRQATDLKLYLENVQASIALELTINGGYVLFGVTVMLMMLKLWIIIKGVYSYENQENNTDSSG